MMLANAPSLNISNRDVPQSSGSSGLFAERTEISDMVYLSTQKPELQKSTPFHECWHGKE